MALVGEGGQAHASHFACVRTLMKMNKRHSLWATPLVDAFRGKACGCTADHLQHNGGVPAHQRSVRADVLT
jgi:hypothetical protein